MAGFMLRTGRWKYCYYGDRHAPQLFDLDDDPFEQRDLSANRHLVGELDDQVRSILDPDETDRRAKADQARRALAAARP